MVDKGTTEQNAADSEVQQPLASPSVKLVTVRSGSPGRVGIIEDHPDHPDGGEARVFDDPKEVAITPAVRAAIRSRQLLVVGDMPDELSTADADLAGSVEEERRAQAVVKAADLARKREKISDLSIAHAWAQAQAHSVEPIESHADRAATLQSQIDAAKADLNEGV